jgi:hypothetical protein
MEFKTWEDWMAYPWSFWDLIDRLDMMVEENRGNTATLVFLAEMLATPEWNLMATRQVPEGVGARNFFDRNQAVIAKCEKYRDEVIKTGAGGD